MERRTSMLILFVLVSAVVASPVKHHWDIVPPQNGNLHSTHAEKGQQSSHQDHHDEAETHRWVDSLFSSEGEQEPDHHHHQYAMASARELLLTPSHAHHDGSKGQAISAHHNDAQSPEYDADFMKWMDNVITDGSPEHHVAHDKSMSRPHPMKVSNFADLFSSHHANPSPFVPTHSISETTSSSSIKSHQGSGKEHYTPQQGVATEEKRKVPKASWSSRYSIEEQKKIRQAADFIAITRHGSTSRKRRHDVLKRLDTKQIDLLGQTGIPVPVAAATTTSNTLDSDSNSDSRRKMKNNQWSKGFDSDQLTTLHDFADLVMDQRGASSVSVRNALMRSLSRQELNDIIQVLASPVDPQNIYSSANDHHQHNDAQTSLLNAASPTLENQAHIHQWVDSLFSDEPNASHEHHASYNPHASYDHHASSSSPYDPPHIGASDLYLSHEKQPAFGNNPHSPSRPEKDADFFHWMEAVFASQPEYNQHHQLYDMPSPLLDSASPSSSLPQLPHHNIQASSSSAGRSILTTQTSHDEPVTQTAPSSRSKKMDHRNAVNFRKRLRRAADEIVAYKFGSSSTNRRHYLLQKMSQEQKDHLGNGGSINTLPSLSEIVDSDMIARKRRKWWTDGYRLSDVVILRQFADEVMALRKASAVSTKNELMSTLTHQEKIAIIENNEAVKKAILDRFRPKKPGPPPSKIKQSKAKRGKSTQFD